MIIKERLNELIAIYGNLSQVAIGLSIDKAYVHRLYTGEKSEPSEEILNKLGLKKIITYTKRGY